MIRFSVSPDTPWSRRPWPRRSGRRPRLGGLRRRAARPAADDRLGRRVVNAFNLMDNMDGAAAHVAARLGARRRRRSPSSHGDVALAALALALARRVRRLPAASTSRSPARIFLGDGGSMPIGFVVAALVMAVPATSRARLARCSLALLLVGLPVARHDARGHLAPPPRRLGPDRRPRPPDPPAADAAAVSARGCIDAGLDARRALSSRDRCDCCGLAGCS